MKLIQILDEIAIGFNNTDGRSLQLKSYIEEVRAILEKEGSFFLDRRHQLLFKSEDLQGSNMFFQGSYATSTAIKYRSFDVDADIAITTDKNLDLDSRKRIYHTLIGELGNKGYIIDFKKPCITIDFTDSYKIDLTLYSSENNELYLHNSISGAENKTLSKPKDFIEIQKKYFRNYPGMRKVLRLTKHFITSIQESHDIPNADKIPSVSLVIFMIKEYKGKTTLELNNEEDLHTSLVSFLYAFSRFVKVNKYNGPSFEEFEVKNTFYKVNSIENVLKVLDIVVHAVDNKNYALLTNENIIKAIEQKSRVDVTPSLLGTMGNG